MTSVVTLSCPKVDTCEKYVCEGCGMYNSVLFPLMLVSQLSCDPIPWGRCANHNGNVPNSPSTFTGMSNPHPKCGMGNVCICYLPSDKG